MNEEITVSPLVDILSKQLGEQVVMSGDTYVYHAGLLPVSQSDVDVALLEQQAILMENLTNSKKDKITNSFNKAVESITTALPHEMVSWRKQEDEARTYSADNTVATPFIDAQLVTRDLGETKDELVAKVITNAEAYQVAYATLLGKFQNLTSKINTAATVDELNSVVW
jgi:Arc/MetJ family transcription regulator